LNGSLIRLPLNETIGAYIDRLVMAPVTPDMVAGLYMTDSRALFDGVRGFFYPATEPLIAPDNSSSSADSTLMQ